MFEGEMLPLDRKGMRQKYSYSWNLEKCNIIETQQVSVSDTTGSSVIPCHSRRYFRIGGMAVIGTDL